MLENEHQPVSQPPWPRETVEAIEQLRHGDPISDLATYIEGAQPAIKSQYSKERNLVVSEDDPDNISASAWKKAIVGLDDYYSRRSEEFDRSRLIDAVLQATAKARQTLLEMGYQDRLVLPNEFHKFTDEELAALSQDYVIPDKG